MPSFTNFVCCILLYVSSLPLRNAETDKNHHLDTGPELYKEAPIGLQVVGYRQSDEALLNTARVLDSIINEKI